MWYHSWGQVTTVDAKATAPAGHYRPVGLHRDRDPLRCILLHSPRWTDGTAEAPGRHRSLRARAGLVGECLQRDRATPAFVALSSQNTDTDEPEPGSHGVRGSGEASRTRRAAHHPRGGRGAHSVPDGQRRDHPIRNREPVGGDRRDHPAGAAPADRPVGTQPTLKPVQRGYLEALVSIDGVGTPLARQHRAAMDRYVGVHLIAGSVTNACSVSIRRRPWAPRW